MLYFSFLRSGLYLPSLALSPFTHYKIAKLFLTLEHMLFWLLISPMLYSTPFYLNNPSLPGWFLNLWWEVLLVVCHRAICVFCSIALMKLYCNWFPRWTIGSPKPGHRYILVMAYPWDQAQRWHKADFQRYFWSTKQQMPNKTSISAFRWKRSFK